MKRSVGKEYMESVKLWLREQKKKNRNIYRLFSDVRPVATLIQIKYPKLVNLNCYPPCNSTELKLKNWEIFNTKVLTKLGIKQTQQKLEKLARGDALYIEKFLNKVMLQMRPPEKRVKKETKENTSEPNSKGGSQESAADRAMVEFATFEKIWNESKKKDELLEIAQQKITHMENLLALKNERIDELVMLIKRYNMTQRFINPHLPANNTKHV